MSNDSGRFPEEIKHVKFCDIMFSPDSKGIFYQVLPLRIFIMLYNW